MAYSRGSFPLFAICLIVIAAYMVYLITAKNIFNVAILNQSDVIDSSVVDDPTTEEGATNTHDSFFDVKNIKRIISSNTKKIIMGRDRKIKSESEKTESIKNNQELVNKTDAATSTFPSVEYPDLEASAQSPSQSPAQSAQAKRDVELQGYWKKYSALVRPLYSRPLNASTEENLSRIGQLSAQLDQLYKEDTAVWAKHLEAVRGEFVTMAAGGEREGARALSFQYFHPPLYKTVEALAWAMIANAIAPNDYYLYICAEESSQCLESVFEQASEQAKHYSAMYNFLPKK